MTAYKGNLNSQKNAPDPWNDLANAIVEQAAEDFRKNMKKVRALGDRMTGLERSILRGRISEIEVFFTSDYGYMVSRGLAPVIWEKLVAEFRESKDWVDMRKVGEKKNHTPYRIGGNQK